MPKVIKRYVGVKILPLTDMTVTLDTSAYDLNLDNTIITAEVYTSSNYTLESSMVTYHFEDKNSVLFERGSNNINVSIYIYWQITQFDSSVKVFRNYTALNLSGTSVSAYPVGFTKNKSIVLFSQRTGSVVYTNAAFVTSTWVDDGTVTWDRGNSSANMYIFYQFVQFTGATVQHLTGTITATPQNVSIPITINTTKSLFFATFRVSSVVGAREFKRGMFTSGTNIQVISNAHNYTWSYSFQVVEFLLGRAFRNDLTVSTVNNDTPISFGATVDPTKCFIHLGSSNSYWTTCQDYEKDAGDFGVVTHTVTTTGATASRGKPQYNCWAMWEVMEFDGSDISAISDLKIINRGLNRGLNTGLIS